MPTAEPELINAYLCVNCKSTFKVPSMRTEGKCTGCDALFYNYADKGLMHECYYGGLFLAAAHTGKEICPGCECDNLTRIIAIDCLECPDLHLPGKVPEHCIGTTISHVWSDISMCWTNTQDRQLSFSSDALLESVELDVTLLI